MANSEELRTIWRKSSFSGPDSNCVEVAYSTERTRVRDSKQPSGPVLAFPPDRWACLLDHLAG